MFRGVCVRQCALLWRIIDGCGLLIGRLSAGARNVDVSNMYSGFAEVYLRVCMVRLFDDINYAAHSDGNCGHPTTASYALIARYNYERMCIFDHDTNTQHPVSITVAFDHRLCSR